jgi:glutamate 5-kinase
MHFLRHNVRRVVVKIGTNTLTARGKAIHTERVDALCAQIAALREQQIEVVIVSSGAIGLGMGLLGLERRPMDLPDLQACAALGQPLLMALWQRGLQPHALQCAQVLLTREDVRGRARHVAVRDTLERLLKLGTIPVINENDTVSADEIKFGDNDVLSALTASLLRADLLVILSTIPGLIDRQGSGAVVPVVEEITPAIRAMAGGAESATSVGGMITKIDAAAIARESGCATFIGAGDDPAILLHLAAGRAQGTVFLPAQLPLDARKRWIAFFAQPCGALHIDAGASAAIQHQGRSLLAGGIVRCDGAFHEGDVVNIHNPDGRVVARGLSHFDAGTVRSLLGRKSAEIRALLPNETRPEVVHRNSLVLIF